MNGITVLVDADACPVVKSVERIEKVTMFPLCFCVTQTMF